MSGFDRYAGPSAAVRSRPFGERAGVSWTVWVQAGQQRMRCHTVDVRARGAKLRPRGPFPVGTPLQMEFIKPAGQRLRVSGGGGRARADARAFMVPGTAPPGLTEAETSR